MLAMREETYLMPQSERRNWGQFSVSFREVRVQTSARDRLSRYGIFAAVCNLPRQMPVYCFEIGHDSFLVKIYSFAYSESCGIKLNVAAVDKE
jgi:hypothetical protein